MMHPFAPSHSIFDALHAMPGCSLDTTQCVVAEGEHDFTVSARAPGVRAEDIVIKIKNERIEVNGETVTKTHSHFVTRAVHLPADVMRVADVTNATAEVADGLITLTIPKKVATDEAGQVIRIVVSSDAESDDDEDDQPGDAYHLTVATAGIRAQDLELLVEAPGVLKVMGETKRTQASIARRFRLPRDADLTSASATNIDGLLKVLVPKTNPTEILVKINGTSATPESRRQDAEKAPATKLGNDDKMAEAPKDEASDEWGVMV